MTMIALDDDLMSKAGLLTGLHENSALVREALKALIDPNVREAQDRLQRSLGLKVRIEDKAGKGRVIIEYARLEDFDQLLETIVGSQP